jgi:hypothetical protein
VLPLSTWMRRVARAQLQAGKTSKFSALSMEILQTNVSGTMAAQRASKPRYMSFSRIPNQFPCVPSFQVEGVAAVSSND